MERPYRFWYPLFLATFAAAAVQPLVLLLWLVYQSGVRVVELNGSVMGICAVVMAVASIVLVVVGIPVFLLLRHVGHHTATVVGLAGLLIAVAMPASMWPSHLAGYSAGNNWHGQFVNTYVNGSPTRYAWYEYVEGLVQFAMHGLAGSRAFLAMWLKAGGRPAHATGGA